MMSVLAVMMVVGQHKVLVGAVGRKGDGGDAEAGERAPEPVPAAELALVAPRLGPLPRVVSRLAGRLDEGVRVEARDARLGAAVGRLQYPVQVGRMGR